MKTVFRTTLLAFAISGLGWTSTAQAVPGLQKLVGVFQSSRGERFIVSMKGNEVTLRTNAELSKYGLCRAQVTLKTTLLSSSEGFAQAKFRPSDAGCARIDGPITLHYNRAITGVDVHLIDVVIRQGRGRDRGQTMRWHLERTN